MSLFQTIFDTSFECWNKIDRLFLFEVFFSICSFNFRIIQNTIVYGQIFSISILCPINFNQFVYSMYKIPCNQKFWHLIKLLMRFFFFLSSVRFGSDKWQTMTSWTNIYCLKLWNATQLIILCDRYDDPIILILVILHAEFCQ